MTSRIKLNSAFELVPGERGKLWKVKETFTVVSRHGKKLTIPGEDHPTKKAFLHDRYSFAPDTEDVIPAISHDYTYDPTADGSGRKWDDGTPITRHEADHDILLYLMETSEDKATRLLAQVYYAKVKQWGWIPWYWHLVTSKLGFR